jgi:hypothetical protein
MSFHVINLDTSEPHANENGAVIYATGKEAADAAKAMREAGLGRFQPRPVPVDDGAWRAREAGRLADGTYTRLPWDDGKPEGVRFSFMEDAEPSHKCWHYDAMTDETRHHYAHVSVKVPGNIAFTADSAKGAADIQMSMKPGRYLMQFYGNALSAASIRQLANEFIAKYGAVALKFTECPDEIERVYVNGPRSCMAYPASHFRSECHPARVYAAGDLHLAYLETEENDITARVLTWPSRKIYGRVYGDEKIAILLDAQGYTCGELSGARVEKLEDRNGGYVMPYIDGCCSVEDCGDYFRIDGGITAESQNGLIEDDSLTCARCGDRMDEYACTFIEDIEQSWCSHCAENYSFYCDRLHRTCEGEGNRMANGETWSDRALARHGFTCDGTGENYPNGERVTLEDGTVWSSDYFEDNGFVCDGNGRLYSNDDAVPRPNGETWCRDYYEEHADDDADETEAADTRKHVARQGRDESPLQTELPLAIGEGVGARVTWATTPEAQSARRWRARQPIGFPDWYEFEIVEYHNNCSWGGSTVTVKRTSDGVHETWEQSAFRYAGTSTLVSGARDMLVAA